MRVLVCGGRYYKNKARVYEELHHLASQHGWLTIIQGGASGADWLAAAWAREYYHGLISVPAEWNKYGKSAGPIRNKRMLICTKPNMVLAFPGGHGTADMVSRARITAVPVVEITDV